MSRRARLALGAPAVALLLLALVWLGVAAVIRQRLISGLQAWAQDMRATGWTVAHAPPRAAGWWQPAIVLADARLAGAGDTLPGGLGWDAAAIRMAWWPRHPHRLLITASGEESLRLATLPLLRADGGAIVASIDLSNPAAPVPLITDGLTLGQGNAALSLGETVLTIAAHPAAGQGQPLLSLALDARALAAAAAPGLPFDLDLAAVLQGPAPPKGDTSHRIEAWQAKGGSLMIPRLSARSGPTTIEADGSGGLDSGLQPAARATLRITGADALVNQLADAGVLGRGQAMAVGAVLGLLERSPAGGGPPVVTLPLVWADGRVMVGDFTLARSRRVEW